MTTRTAVPALLLAAGLGLTACGSGGSDESAAGLDSEAVPAAAEREAPQAAGDEADVGADTDARVDAVSAQGSDVDPATEPQVIQVGTMTVLSKDVARARFDVDKVVDAYGGSIDDEKTTADARGVVRLSRLVLRVPSADFDEAMADLAELGQVTASTRKAQDVTGQVIDTRARIRAQEQSLRRVEVLFAQAEEIRDIVAIEAQLSRRQADLDSLKGQLAYLEDQASRSTITLYLERATEPVRVAPEDDDLAFVGGLKSGWGALAALGGALATVAGALLPFAVAALLLGVPALLLLRRWLATRTPRPVAEAEA